MVMSSMSSCRNFWWDTNKYIFTFLLMRVCSFVFVYNVYIPTCLFCALVLRAFCAPKTSLPFFHCKGISEFFHEKQFCLLTSENKHSFLYLFRSVLFCALVLKHAKVFFKCKQISIPKEDIKYLKPSLVNFKIIIYMV